MTLSTPAVIIISVYSACGVVLILVGLLGYYLYSLYQKKKLLKTDVENTYGWYPGFTRLTTRNLSSDPLPGTYTAPCTVSIFSMRTHPDEDVLVHVRRCAPLPHSWNPAGALTSTEKNDGISGQAGEMELLGNDNFYHDAFLLFGSPLHFTEAGEYIVQAFTVHHARQEVGAVHQFIFRVADAAVSSNSAEEERLALMRRNRELEINISQDRLLQQQQEAQKKRHRRRHSSSVASTSVAETNPTKGGYAALPPLPPIKSMAALPPRVSPFTGEVTTTTAITITPNEKSRTADQIRYSTDGSYPTVLYTGPFTLSLPPREKMVSAGQEHHSAHQVVVKAIAVAGGANASSAGIPDSLAVSPVVEAHLRVVRGEMSYFDPNVPAPSLQLRALDAKLYFDTERLPTFNGARVYYQIYTVDLARRPHVPFHPEQATAYQGVPVPISSNVARIYAWTVVGSQHSRCAVYDAASGSLRLQRQQHHSNDNNASGVGNLSPYSINPALPPPVLCVSCKEVEVGFEDPPANTRIAYTLNHTEPALTDVYPPACAALQLSSTIPSHSHPNRLEESNSYSLMPSSSRVLVGGGGPNANTTLPPDLNGFHTFLYESGRKIRLSLLEAEGMYITARTFVPLYQHHDVVNASGSGDGAPHHCYGSSHPAGNNGGERVITGYRFSAAFHRGFHYQEGQPMVMLTPAGNA